MNASSKPGKFPSGNTGGFIGLVEVEENGDAWNNLAAIHLQVCPAPALLGCSHGLLTPSRQLGVIHMQVLGSWALFLTSSSLFKFADMGNGWFQRARYCECVAVPTLMGCC